MKQYTWEDLRGENRASNSDERSIDLARSIGGLHNGVGGEEGDSRPSSDVPVLRVRHKHGEGLDGQLGVGGWAGDDEGRGQSVDLVQAQRNVEGGGEGGFAERSADVAGVAGLDGQNGAGRSEVGGRHDVRCCAQVGADTHALEDGRGGDEGLDVCDAKGVNTLGDGLGASLGQGGGQEGNVGGFV